MKARRRLRPTYVKLEVKFIEEDTRGVVVGEHTHPPLVVFEAGFSKVLNTTFLKKLTDSYLTALREAGQVPKE